MPTPHKPKEPGRHTSDPALAAEGRAAACLSPRLTDSSPANTGLLHGIWHKFWSQLAAHGGLLNLPGGHAPVHPGSDRRGAEAAVASWPVAHID